MNVRRRNTTRRPARRPSKLLFWLSIACLCLMFALYLFERNVAERNWLETLITYAPQHFFGAPALILLCMSVFRRDMRPIIINSLALCFFAAAILGLCIPWRSAAWSMQGHLQGKHTTIRVITYNIHHSMAGGIAVADEISKANPDIIVLQEANAVLKWSNTVNEIQRLKCGKYKIDYGELAILSRYPIKYYAPCQMESKTGRIYLKATLDISGHGVDIINVHLNSSLRPWSYISNQANIIEKVESSSSLRAYQVKAMLNDLNTIKTPLIIAGDFNTPPRGMVYAKFTRIYSDAFASAAWGFGNTFRSDVPALRIDYIFLGGGARAKHCYVPVTQASDHRPVVAEIEMPF